MSITCKPVLLPEYQSNYAKKVNDEKAVLLIYGIVPIAEIMVLLLIKNISNSNSYEKKNIVDDCYHHIKFNTLLWNTYYQLYS